MKKQFILLPFVALLGYVTLSSYQSGPGLSGSLERTGATGTTGCAGGGCHGSSAGVTASIELLSGSTPVTTYTPGASYTVRLTGTNSSATSLPKFGFQMSFVRTSTTTNAGSWGSLPAGTHTATPSGVSVVEQGPALNVTTGGGGSGSTYVINIPWMAPGAGTGSLTLRGVVNAVNASSSADGNDRWGGSSLVVTEASGPTAPITGTLLVCDGSTTTLASATSGGTWSSATPGVATVVAATGVVTGVAPGTATINYTVGAATPVSAVVTVNPAPTAIVGTPTVCVGATTTLDCTPAGGTWSITPVTIATINATTGVVSGIAAGTATAVYTAGGCSVSEPIIVNAVGAGIISGSHTVCVGLTTALTNPTAGGTWSSSAVAMATVGSTTGIVTGIAAGTANITYTATNACGTATATHSVNVVPAASCPTAVPVSAVAKNELLLFPNPTTGVFTINMLSSDLDVALVTVTNLTGAKVMQFTLNTNTEKEIALPQVAGIYLVSVTTSNGRFVSRLLIQ